MLAGKLPFQGDYEAAIAYEILNEEGYWTRDGDRMVSMSWIETENPEEQKERY